MYIGKVIDTNASKNMEEWEYLEHQYILYNLFEIAEHYDLSDEVGRKSFQKLVMCILQNHKLQFKLLKKVVGIASKLISSVDTLTHDICQIISDIKEPLIDRPMNQTEERDRTFQIITYRAIPNYNKHALMVSVAAICDLMRIYGPNLFGNGEDVSSSMLTQHNTTKRKLYINGSMDDLTSMHNDKLNIEVILEIILDMLDDEIEDIREIAICAVSKLILNGFPVNSTLMCRIILKWFNPSENYEERLNTHDSSSNNVDNNSVQKGNGDKDTTNFSLNNDQDEVEVNKMVTRNYTDDARDMPPKKQRLNHADTSKSEDDNPAINVELNDDTEKRDQQISAVSKSKNISKTTLELKKEV
ncbi:hypothetical protein NQ315_000558 [Exocentrus adspersus]|uniref:Nuclear condensin complex subunit 3 C-terminal domain-containing protein n=1 Tax=Exocentrus adspersus TaxID=1586481 RepID=A0AAV8VBL1_9CUCU|nr:hypothetical protein NQ315_000558 [Exocentrus adspersus]